MLEVWQGVNREGRGMKSVVTAEFFYHAIFIMAYFYPGTSSAGTAGAILFATVKF